MPKALQPHPDRALPAGEARAVARRIHESTRALPLLCLHGHVDAALFATDEPFGNPADLLVVPDHYVTRMLMSLGVHPDRLGLPRADGSRVAEPRDIWREFCSRWHLFLGTPSRYWLEQEFAEVLGLTVAPSAETADDLYDEISARLTEPEFRPRALLDRFGIEVISTTDAATDDLSQHAKIAADLPGRVIPHLPARRACRPAPARLERPDPPARRPGRHRDDVVRRVSAGSTATPSGLRGGWCAGDGPRPPECSGGTS